MTHRVPVVPWGGGSGTQGGALPVRGGIVVDLRSLAEVIEVDDDVDDRHRAGRQERPRARGRAERPRADAAPLPGVGRVGDGRRLRRRPRLRRALHPLRQDRGSAAVAARGDAGHRPAGDRRRPRGTRSGPELTQLFVGSEGTLGIITRVTLQLVPMPGGAPLRGRRLPERGSAGIGAIRRALQLGHRPSVVRLYDEEATRLAFSPVVGEELVGVYTVLAFEGEEDGGRARGAPRARAGRRGGRRGARPGARAALVGPPLRLLPPAPPARAARHLGHARRGGELRADRGGVRGAADRRARAVPRRRGSSCACTSRTGTRGAR